MSSVSVTDPVSVPSVQTDSCQVRFVSHLASDIKLPDDFIFNFGGFYIAALLELLTESAPMCGGPLRSLKLSEESAQDADKDLNRKSPCDSQALYMTT